MAAFRDVSDPDLVRRHGLFVAEGRLVARRLLESRRFRTRAVLTTEAALEALGDAIEPRVAEVDVFVASPDQLASIGGFNFHRGCLALGERPAPAGLRDLDLTRHTSGARHGTVVSDASADASADGSSDRGARATAGGGAIVVALEALANADNVGGVFRNAEAFGARAVVVDRRTCDPLYRKATRTSMGATLTVPFATVDDWPASFDALRAAGYVLVALTPARDAVDIERAAPLLHGQPLVLLVGSEGGGLSDATLAHADQRVGIAMAPGVDSLNVATATGIALHRLSSSR